MWARTRGGRLVLSLFFKALLGVQRIFHFDSLTDVGFALLTGGRRCLSRRTLGGLVRAVSTRAVGKFVRLTQPAVSSAQRLCVSIDEHVVARFTRKFLIPKGFHTIRNKKMRAEKLFFSFDALGELLPGRFRLTPRFRLDEQSGKWKFLDEKEVQRIVSEQGWKGLTGTIEPDIILLDEKGFIVHVYDLKFPCPETNDADWSWYKSGPWRDRSQWALLRHRDSHDGLVASDALLMF